MKGEKHVLDGVLFFMIDYISASKSQIPFTGLDFEPDKPRMNAEFRVIIG